MPNLILIQNDYPDARVLLEVLNYAMRSGTIGGYALNPNEAYRQMMMVKKAYHKTEGTQLMHFIISFTSAEAYRLGIDEMLQVGFWAAQQLGSFQAAYGLHHDTCHFHLHIVVNTVSYEDGHRYADGLSGFWKIKKGLQRMFPNSDVGLYRSFPRSSENRYSGDKEEDELLRIG